MALHGFLPGKAVKRKSWKKVKKFEDISDIPVYNFKMALMGWLLDWHRHWLTLNKLITDVQRAVPNFNVPCASFVVEFQNEKKILLNQAFVFLFGLIFIAFFSGAIIFSPYPWSTRTEDFFPLGFLSHPGVERLRNRTLCTVSGQTENSPHHHDGPQAACILCQIPSSHGPK